MFGSAVIIIDRFDISVNMLVGKIFDLLEEQGNWMSKLREIIVG